MTWDGPDEIGHMGWDGTDKRYQNWSSIPWDMGTDENFAPSHPMPNPVVHILKPQQRTLCIRSGHHRITIAFEKVIIQIILFQ